MPYPSFRRLAVPSKRQAVALTAAIVAVGVALAYAVPSTGNGAANETPPRAAQPFSFADVIETVSPAVVLIDVRQRAELPQIPYGPPREFFERFFGDRGGGSGAPMPEQRGLGSGFIIDSDGTIVTNDHVVGEADTIRVTLDNGTTHEAALLGRDPKTDLALIKIDADKELPTVAFGDSDALRVGDWVVTIGSPFGLGNSVTTGIVSARDRRIGAGPYDQFLQIDAPINRGNSGGPAFNLAGEVIGINTAILSPSGGNIGIGFAVPSNFAKTIVDDLRDDGKVARGWIGVNVQTVSQDIADSIGLDAARGAMVVGVVRGGPAAAAGLRQGDVILAVDGKPVSEMRHLPSMIAARKAGESVDLTIWRDGAERELAMVLDNYPESEELAAASPPPAAMTP